MTDPLVITEPGVYDGLPAEDYHRDPVPGGSLSSSGARKLLSPSCPALYAYEREHGQGYKAAWDIGHAAHKLVLGDGPDLVRIDANEWRTNAVKAEVAEVRETGGVPLKPADYERVHAMADALREHPAAAALFNPLGGRPEQSLFWKDGPSGITRRARLDWLPFPTPSRRLIVPDYKSCIDASPDGIEKAVAAHGLHQQSAWYLDAVVALGLATADEVAFVFCFQEKTAPYLVTVAELTVMTLDIGRQLNRLAINTYAECVRSGRWPGYSDDVIYTSLPRWAEARALEEIS